MVHSRRWMVDEWSMVNRGQATDHQQFPTILVVYSFAIFHGNPTILQPNIRETSAAWKNRALPSLCCHGSCCFHPSAQRATGALCAPRQRGCKITWRITNFLALKILFSLLISVVYFSLIIILFGFNFCGEDFSQLQLSL